MRAWFSLGALLVGLCLCGAVGAQTTTTSNNTPPRAGASQKVNDVSPNFFFRARTRLRDIFGNTSANPARHQGTISSVPDPSSPEYFKPFNIRQVGGR